MTAEEARLLATLPAWSFAFVLLLARIGAAMAMLPGLGESTAPAMLRAGLALSVTILLLPTLAPTLPQAPEPGLQAAAMIAAELVTGLALGWLARVAMLALPMAGQVIAYLLGVSSVLQPNADLGAQSTVLATLFGIAAPLIVLVSGLYQFPLAALAGSYRVIAPGALLPATDGTAVALNTLSDAFGLVLRLAAPFILCGIVWHVAIGVAARVVPRVQIYFVAMPGQILGGLALLAALAATLLAAYRDALRAAFGALPGLG